MPEKQVAEVTGIDPTLYDTLPIDIVKHFLLYLFYLRSKVANKIMCQYVI